MSVYERLNELNEPSVFGSYVAGTLLRLGERLWISKFLVLFLSKLGVVVLILQQIPETCLLLATIIRGVVDCLYL